MFEGITGALVAVAAISLISLVGVLFVSMTSTRLSSLMVWFIGISVGALLGDAFIHLIPEAHEALGGASAYWILAGMSLFFILEKILHWHHHHEPHLDEDDCHDCHDNHIKPFGVLIIFSDAIHNIIDGAIIAAGFLISPEVGLATAIAVALHEIPQEIGDFGVLVHSGLSKGRALLFNFVSALTAFAGAGLVFAIGSSFESAVPIASAMTAGGFIYIATVDLVPELHKTVRVRTSIVQLIAVCIGVGLMSALTLIEVETTPHLTTAATTKPTENETPHEPVSLRTWYIDRVIDGDTIVVEEGHIQETVRLVGIDAPEMNATNSRPPECYAPEATNLLAALLPLGTAVTLVPDPTQDERDQYGRLLAYVFLGDQNINGKLVADGAAQEYSYRNHAHFYQKDFRAHEAAASASLLGLWSACGAH